MKIFGAQTKNAVASITNLDNKSWFNFLTSYPSSINALTDLFRLLRYISIGTSSLTAPLISPRVSTSNESNLTGNQTCKHKITLEEISHGGGECSSHLMVPTTNKSIYYFISKSC